MPFTYLSESTARRLAALVGPVVIYQPLKTNIPDTLTALASQGLVEIRTPFLRDDDRLRAALAEFTDWARLHPGKSTPGAGFFSARQGEVPFFDETTVNRIRSDIKRYNLPDGRPDHQADDQSPDPAHDRADGRADQTEACFSARLFLSLAQENDRATDHLDHDLSRFKALEKEFLASLEDAHEADFNRQGLGNVIWRDDPGAKLTAQRMRAWATLALADAEPPDMLITTSRAVIDTLLESCGEALGIKKLAGSRLAVQDAATVPLVGGVLADLAVRDSLQSEDLAAFEALAADAACEPAVTVTLFIAANRTPASVIRRMAPGIATPAEQNRSVKSLRHTLIVLVEG
jgi:hypothetical protein